MEDKIAIVVMTREMGTQGKEVARSFARRMEYTVPKGGYLTPEDVLEIALEGDVLVRGWGATRLLKSVPNVLSVRVCAPMASGWSRCSSGSA